MSTNNPFAHHTNNLFASRGCDIDAAIAYANEMITALPVDQHIHATTALMVVINTASNAFAQAQGPGPEKIAVMELVGQIVDDRIREALDSLDDRIDEWVNNSMSFEDACDNRVERWIENNLDLSKQVEEAINDLDLVVRVR